MVEYVRLKSFYEERRVFLALDYTLCQVRFTTPLYFFSGKLLVLIHSFINLKLIKFPILSLSKVSTPVISFDVISVDHECWGVLVWIFVVPLGSQLGRSLARTIVSVLWLAPILIASSCDSGWLLVKYFEHHLSGKQ